MKKTYWVLAALVVAAAAAWAMNAPVTHADEKVKLEELPPAVRTALEQHAGGGRIVEVEKEMKGGKVVYEAEVVKDGEEMDIVVSAAGEFLGKEMDDDDGEDEDDGDDADDDGEGDGGEQRVSWGDLPDAVRDTLNSDYAGVEFRGLSREVEDGFERYEAAYMEGNKKREIKLSADGHVLESEEKTSYDGLPPAVQGAIDHHFRGAKFEGAETVQVTFYEVALEMADGSEIEVKVLADGQLLEEEEDD